MKNNSKSTELITLNNDLITRQSNYFIESYPAQEFSVQELKIIEYIISQTGFKDLDLIKNKQNKEIEISVIDFSKMINANKTQIYRDANKIANSLLCKKIDFKYIDKKGLPAFIKKNFFAGVTYENGSITFEINHFALSYFVEIKEKFTEINLKYIVEINSSYGIILYKLLKQYIKIGKRKFSIDELRKHFGLGENQYKLYSNFKKTLNTAIKNINENSDINISFLEHKIGKSIKEITFIINN